jgi:hypothetical protein
MQDEELQMPIKVYRADATHSPTKLQEHVHAIRHNKVTIMHNTS